jgi:Zn-dependent protease with chaperone function
VIAALRATLALGLLISWYAVAATMVVLCLAFDVLMFWSQAQPSSVWSPTPLFAAIACFTIVLGIMHGVLSVSRPDVTRPGAVAVSRRTAPDLWATVDDLASRVGVAPPAELFLIAEANAAVTEQARMLGLLPGRRSMYVGIPLLLGLGTDELRAVLCHELGHYTRGHTRFGALTWRGSAALRETRLYLQRSAARNRLFADYGALLHLFIAGYANLYDRLTLALRRRQEFAADLAAARVAGAAVTASALRGVHALAFAWEEFQLHLVKPSLSAGLRPDDQFAAFATMLADPDYRDVLADRRDTPPDQPPSPWDSHPSLTRRLSALAAETAPAAESAPAGGELIVPREARRSLAATLGRGLGAPKPLPWREWLEKTAERQALGPVYALSDVMSGRHPGSAMTLETVLHALDAGEGPGLAAVLEGEGPAAPPLEHLAEAITMLIGHHLVAGRQAAWLVGWTGRVRLVCRSTTVDDLHELVRAAAEDPSDVARLRLYLAELSVAPETRVLPETDDTPMVTITAPRPKDRYGELRASLRENRGPLTVLVAVVAVGLLIHFGTSHESTVPTYRPVSPMTPAPLRVPPPLLLPSVPAIPPSYVQPCGTGPACRPFFTLPPLPLPTVVLKPRR